MEKYGLFDAYGIEIEYMIVAKDDLTVLPISDKVLEVAAAERVSDFEDGFITWSNELVLHVLELKTTAPSPTLTDLDKEFYRSVKNLNQILDGFGARLLPTAMHPFMDPKKDMHLWPHDNAEIYSAFDKAFGCQGHGWSNLQSMHLNLPFASEDEFVRLHSAIRIVLPLLPALAASSPIVESKTNETLDNRLLFYQMNQRKIPSITAQVIPEPIRSLAEYNSVILQPMYEDISTFDPDGILQEDWLNSRGAIARFNRNTIEIRVIDSQECPKADLALASCVSALARALTEENLSSLETQIAVSTGELKTIFDRSLVEGLRTNISNPKILKTLGVNSKTALSIGEIWKDLLARPQIKREIPHDYIRVIMKILEDGCLAERMLRALGSNPSHRKILSVYRRLGDCLDANNLFSPEISARQAPGREAQP